MLMHLLGMATAQSGYDVRLLSMEEGLSHRNVFSIGQDSAGWMWMGTIDGLNRYDGQQFSTAIRGLPNTFIQQLGTDNVGNLWAVLPNRLLQIDQLSDTVKIDFTTAISKQLPSENWTILDLKHDVRSTWISVKTTNPSSVHLLVYEAGSWEKLASRNGKASSLLLDGASCWWRVDQVLHEFSRDLKTKSPLLKEQRGWHALVDAKVGSTAYAINENGLIFERKEGAWQALELPQIYGSDELTAAFYEPQERRFWIGGYDRLAVAEIGDTSWTDLNEEVRLYTQHAPTYRQFFADRLGHLWIATDYGAVQLIENQALFTNFLSGGSSFCQEGFCSLRGIAEDSTGQLFVAYYNSIHRLNPRTGKVSTLFRYRDFAYLPFGLHWLNGMLYTGNGLAIDPIRQTVDTLFESQYEDQGVVTSDSSGTVWFGYHQLLYSLTENKGVQLWGDFPLPWNQSTTIAHLEVTPTQELLVSTNENGLFLLNPRTGSSQHFAEAELPSLRVLVATEIDGTIWAGTAAGLVRIEAPGRSTLFDSDRGLPNDFINGLLVEGDTAIWVSTDRGLHRLSIATERISSFFQPDGLPANEFNRISFLKTKQNTFIFGGLNGLTCFEPDQTILRKRKQYDAPWLLTGVERYDRRRDTLLSNTLAEALDTPLIFGYQERMMTFQYALADYQPPSPIQYSYRLNGYEREWSLPSTNHSTTYNNVPAGNYRFEVRARYGRGPWLSQNLSVPVTLKEPFYQKNWFWLSCALALVAITYLIGRYRIYQVEKRERKLQTLVEQRTVELKEEQQKADRLLLNILPAETAAELKANGKTEARHYDQVTVFFSDVVGFSKIAKQISAETLIRELDQLIRLFDAVMETHGIEKIKTIGDAYMAVGGMKTNATEAAVQVVSAALAIQERLAEWNTERAENGTFQWNVRIGIHTGPAVAGVVGTHKFAYDVWGDTVNIAARLEEEGAAGKVNISATTHELVKSKFQVERRGKIEIYNLGEVEMYFVGTFGE